MPAPFLLSHQINRLPSAPSEHGSNRQQEELALVTKHFKKMLRAHTWNSMGFFASIIIWGALYYARENYKQKGDYSYAIQCIIEALGADLAALPFFLKARMGMEDTSLHALKKTLRDIPTYFPLDCVYPVIGDLLVAYGKGESFKEYADPTFKPKEIALAAAFYLGAFSTFYGGIGKLMQVEGINIPCSLVIGMQYFSCYVAGALFAEVDPPDGMPNLIYSGLGLSVLSFMMDIAPDLWSFLKAKYQAHSTEISLQIEEKVEQKPDEIDRLEVEISAPYFPLLDLAEEVDLDEQEERSPRRQGCCARMSRLFFWSGSKPALPASSVASVPPVSLRL